MMKVQTGMQSANTKALSGVKIVIVDDERLTLKLLSAILKGSGAEVATYSNAQEMMETIDLATMDLLISDMHMPIQDGHSLMREIRRLPDHRARIPAIAMTAYAQQDVLARALMEGYHVTITKPVDPKELIKLVCSLIGRE